MVVYSVYAVVYGLNDNESMTVYTVYMVYVRLLYKSVWSYSKSQFGTNSGSQVVHGVIFQQECRRE